MFHRIPTRRYTLLEGGKLVDGTFFRRVLPKPSIELSSSEGTLMFSESLQAGNAKCFFRLMEQLHTQNEPEYCGLASLVTVLNALNIDPHRRWKGNWRFYSEELLECCEPLTLFKEHGINLDKLTSLARCNGLEAQAHRASDSSLQEFRSAVQEASQVDSFSLVLAYSRKRLNQTGSGHYSPMGAYHEPSDHLLILDCARFKYRPHWVPLPLMFEAMKQVDEDTQKSRGYVRLSPRLNGPPPAAQVLRLYKRPSSFEHLPKELSRDFASLAEPGRVDGPAEFLREAHKILSRSWQIDLQGNGCLSRARRAKVTEQLREVESWDNEALPMDSDRSKALVMCLPAAFLDKVLADRTELRALVHEWIQPTGEELAVEIYLLQQEMRAAFGV